METIRKLRKVIGKKIMIDMPESFYGKEVEIIVIPHKKTSPVNDKNEWKKDFLSISQWDITKEEIAVKSWPIKEL